MQGHLISISPIALEELASLLELSLFYRRVFLDGYCADGANLFSSLIPPLFGSPYQFLLHNFFSLCISITGTGQSKFEK